MQGLLEVRVLMAMLILASFSACDKEQLSDIEEPNNDANTHNQVLFADIHIGPSFPYIVRLVDGSGKIENEGVPYDILRERMIEQANSILSDYEISTEIAAIYAKVFSGFAIELTTGEADAMREDLRVIDIESDQSIRLDSDLISLQPTDVYTDTGMGQITSWGVHEVGQSDGTGKSVWILDTGIDLDHPDLNVDTDRSITYLSDVENSSSSADDLHGHGTLLAGIVGAKDNSIGVKGVAAGANLIAVKVLNHQGEGQLCHLLAGVDYVSANAEPGDVALIGVSSEYSTILDEAIRAQANKSIKWVIAAGSVGDDCSASSPACADQDNIYTVSAMDRMYELASFSNHGSPVDFAAPGVYVNSTSIGGDYAYANGAGIAAAHVAGILTVGEVTAGGFVSNDPDGSPDPIARLTF